MSLLQPTNNLMSNIMAASKSPVPEVGMGATKLMYTDRHAGTIVAVTIRNGDVIAFDWQEDISVRVDGNGMSDSQSYEYKLNPYVAVEHVTFRRRNGRWVKQGESLRNGTAFAVGYRDTFHDFSF